MKECKVGIAQMDITPRDKETNLTNAAETISLAAKQEADFICLPEYLSTGNIPEQCRKLAEPVPGYTIDKLAVAAAEHGMYVVTSILETADNNIFNTAVLIGPNGQLLTKYRKIHLFMDEQAHLAHGRKHAAADTKFGKVGLMICYDAVFPEVARKLALQRVGIIFMPANWPNPFVSQWQLATSARALDNQIWLVAANRIGADNKFTYFGRSRIINPYGDAVVECSEKEDVLVTTVDRKVTEEFKKTVNFLNDRQPNAYL